MNHAQNSSSFPHALCTRQFYRHKKPLFEIGSLLFGATRMPQACPSTNATTANLEPYHRQAQVYPSDRGLLLGLNHCRCHRCRLRVFFARFATLRQSLPIAKTKILTFLQLFFDWQSSPTRKRRKKASQQLICCTFEPISVFKEIAAAPNRKKVAERARFLFLRFRNGTIGFSAMKQREQLAREGNAGD